MKTTVGPRILTWSELITLLAETEAAVNSRPITYVSSDAESRALRPVDFLTGLPSGIDENQSILRPQDFGETGRQLVNLWKQRSRYLDKLWQQWYAEYLQALRESSEPFHLQGRSDRSDSPVIGQIVLVADQDLSHGSWSLARVTDLVRSQDGLVRGAQIRLPNGSLIRRAVNFVLRLELPPSEEIQNAVADRSHSPTMGTSGSDVFLGYDPTDLEEVRRRLRQFGPSDSDSDSDCTVWWYHSIESF